MNDPVCAFGPRQSERAQLALLAPVDPERNSATWSPCRKYRYTLTRIWGDHGGRLVTWLMLNPSTADELANDPTIERCERRARNWGYDGLIVVNLFAWRSTDPRGMKRQADPVGQANNAAILEAAVRAHQSGGIVVCAWGTHGAHRDRSSKVVAMLAGIPLFCLDVTKDGEPVHPLYQAYEKLPVPYLRHGKKEGE